MPDVTFDTNWLRAAAEAVKAYPVQELVQRGLDGKQIADELKRKRLERLAEWRRSLS